jgi:ABC-type antimicrobial peptide transport system permease subunit
VDASLPLYAASSMESVVAGTMAPRRMQTLLVAGFGAIALGLAAIGVYGVLAYAVAQRTREIGVRMALGAHRQRIIGMVMRQGFVLVAAGAVIGLVGAAAATRVLDGMLYGVASRDAATFGAGAFVIVMVGSVAALIPAWRAATADPLDSLRTD